MQNNSQSRHGGADSKSVVPSEARGLRAKCSPVDEAAPAEMVRNFATGVVTDCLRLNIRKTSSPDGEVLAIIDLLSEVLVDLEASTDEFYKVFTAAGIEGFCMKKYIVLRR